MEFNDSKVETGLKWKSLRRSLRFYNYAPVLLFYEAAHSYDSTSSLTMDEIYEFDLNGCSWNIDPQVRPTYDVIDNHCSLF
jgi:hypothetical protein